MSVSFVCCTREVPVTCPPMRARRRSQIGGLRRGREGGRERLIKEVLIHTLPLASKDHRDPRATSQQPISSYEKPLHSKPVPATCSTSMWLGFNSGLGVRLLIRWMF